MAQPRLVLVGGGHSHALVLDDWRHRGLPAADLLLISDGNISYYSGLMPGLIAGSGDPGQAAIDLLSLCRRSGVSFHRARVIGLDAERRELQMESGDRLAYDWLSLDVGSTPPLPPSAGAGCLAVKPLAPFLEALECWLARQRSQFPGAVRRVAVIGGGVAGVELVLALRQRFERDLPDATVELVLLQRTADLLPGAAAGLRQRCRQVLARRGIRVMVGAGVTAVAPGPELQLENGDRLSCDLVVWATGAAAPPWLAASGLTLDEAGFVRVGPSLQSVSHPRVFASGDVAGFSPPLPKAGVYAVRQGPILAENLRRAIAGCSLRAYRPQRQALALIGTGTGAAIAARGPWSAGPHPMWWWLKQRIDRDFMARFRPD